MNALTLVCVLLVVLAIFSLGASFDYRRERNHDAEEWDELDPDSADYA